MGSVPSRRKLVNTRKRTLEAIRLAGQYGFPIPSILTHLLLDPTIDTERLEEWSPDCAGGWIAVAYSTAILHAGMRCGKCWECVVHRFHGKAEREAAMFDLLGENFGVLYELEIPVERWEAERKWLRRNGCGWRAWTHADWGTVGGYTDAKTGQIVSQSNYVPRFVNKTDFLHNVGTLVDDLTIRFPYCRSGGTFDRSDLRIYKGGTQIRPTPSRTRVLEVAEILEGRVGIGVSAWETEQVIVTFSDETTTVEAVRLLKSPRAA